VKDPRTYAIIGAGMRVHSELGPGYLEKVYHDALQIEFAEHDIPHRREVPLPIAYRGKPLGHPYYADFLCHHEVIVEIKAQTDRAEVDRNQLIHYLKGTGCTTGILLNFGERRLDFQRFIYVNGWHAAPVTGLPSHTEAAPSDASESSETDPTQA
jgi:GxxExxY protein